MRRVMQQHAFVTLPLVSIKASTASGKKTAIRTGALFFTYPLFKADVFWMIPPFIVGQYDTLGFMQQSAQFSGLYRGKRHGFFQHDAGYSSS